MRKLPPMIVSLALFLAGCSGSGSDPSPFLSDQIRPAETFQYPSSDDCQFPMVNEIEAFGIPDNSIPVSGFNIDPATNTRSQVWEYFSIGRISEFRWDGNILGCEVTVFFFTPI